MPTSAELSELITYNQDSRPGATLYKTDGTGTAITGAVYCMVQVTGLSSQSFWWGASTTLYGLLIYPNGATITLDALYALGKDNKSQTSESGKTVTAEQMAYLIEGGCAFLSCAGGYYYGGGGWSSGGTGGFYRCSSDVRYLSFYSGTVNTGSTSNYYSARLVR